jgi:hypothetical protein
MPSPHAVVLRWLLNGLAIASRVVRRRVTVEAARSALDNPTLFVPIAGVTFDCRVDRQ